MERKYSQQHEKLEKALGYSFTNKDHLLLALTHSTYAYEHRKLGVVSNQRLEFLGDAILDFIIGEEIYKSKSSWDEGKLSKTRALVVCEKTLSKVAEELLVGNLLFLGKGEEGTGGREKISTLADTMESLFAAIYLDGGFDAAKEVILRCLRPYIDQALHGELIFDYKSRLLEKAQMKNDPHRVLFDVVREDGPVHDRVFEVAVLIDGQEVVRAEGRSKKQAEQEASRLALEIWKQ
ncbi:MAG: ribonuclease III [Clostridiales bacterium]|nr:ribonuclease III [Clostridiales bacterium]